MRPHAIESRGAKDVEILRKDFLVPAYPAAFTVRVPLSRTRAAWMHFFGNAADDLDNVRVAGAPHLVFLEHPLNLFGRRTENLRTVKIDNVGESHRKSPPGERKGFPTLCGCTRRDVANLARIGQGKGRSPYCKALCDRAAVSRKRILFARLLATLLQSQKTVKGGVYRMRGSIVRQCKPKT